MIPSTGTVHVDPIRVRVRVRVRVRRVWSHIHTTLRVIWIGMEEGRPAMSAKSRQQRHELHARHKLG